MTYALRLSEDESARYRMMAECGPAWAAREALVAARLASDADVACWSAAFDEVDTRAQRPEIMMATFGAWGPVDRGRDAVTGTFTWVGSRFSDGALVPRNDVVVVSGDLAYTPGVSTAWFASTAASRPR